MEVDDEAPVKESAPAQQSVQTPASKPNPIVVTKQEPPVVAPPKQP